MMRFGWIFAAAAALFVQVQPAGAVEIVTLTNITDTSVTFYHRNMLPAWLDEIAITGGTPGAEVHMGGFFDPVIGTLDSAGNWSLPSSIDVGHPSGVVYFVLSTYVDRKRNIFTLDHLTVSGEAFATPEPATWAMLLLGVGFIGAALRNRAKLSPEDRASYGV